MKIGRESSAEAWSAAVQIKKLPYDRRELNSIGKTIEEIDTLSTANAFNASEPVTQKLLNTEKCWLQISLRAIGERISKWRTEIYCETSSKTRAFFQSHTKLSQLIVVPSILARISARLSSALLRYRFAILFFFLLYLIFSDRSHTFRSAKRWSCRWKVASGFSLFRADSTAALRSCVVIGHRRNHTAKKNKKASLKLAHPNTQHSALIRIWRKKYEWMKLSKIFSFFTLERLKLPATYRSDSLFFFWSKKISHTRDSDGDFNLHTIFRLFGGTFMESHKHSAALAQESRLQFNSLFRH